MIRCIYGTTHLFQHMILRWWLLSQFGGAAQSQLATNKGSRYLWKVQIDKIKYWRSKRADPITNLRSSSSQRSYPSNEAPQWKVTIGHGLCIFATPLHSNANTPPPVNLSTITSPLPLHTTYPILCRIIRLWFLTPKIKQILSHFSIRINSAFIINYW